LILSIFLFGYCLYLGWLWAHRLFREYPFTIQAWAAVLFGLTGLMWSVIPFAFLFGFSRLAHFYGVLLLSAITVLILRFVPVRFNIPTSERLPQGILISILGFSLLIFGMIFMHTLLPKDGGLYAGPGSYGDLPLHLGMITGLAEQKTFPPDYYFFPGARLAYPFLVNSLSASLYLFGMPLRSAVMIPSFFLAFAVVTGFLVLARTITCKTAPTILAALLFFSNGGFGFVYYLGGLKKNPEIFTRLFAFTGTTPTPNNWATKNLYMWNVISHILVPQRASLAGWAVLFFALWLLYRAVTRKDARFFMLAGIMAGLMPMIHTASFFILVAIALTWFVVYLFSSEDKKHYGLQWLKFWLPLILLALPQLHIWTFTQVTSERYLRFHFNWVNKSDPWLWFWIKNVGPVFLLALPAILASPRERLKFYSGAITVFLIAEFVVFSQYAHDNNKAFFIWLAFTVMLVAEYLVLVYQRMKGLRGRGTFLGIIIFVSVFSGALTVTHDFICSWKVFSDRDVEAAEFVKTATPTDAIFLSSHFHNNPVNALAGRTILCGYDGWTFSFGLDYGPRAADIKKMYSRPEAFDPLREKYGVDYVIFSSRERSNYKTGPEYFENRYPKIFDNGQMAIYAVSERAISLSKTTPLYQPAKDIPATLSGTGGGT